MYPSRPTSARACARSSAGVKLATPSRARASTSHPYRRRWSSATSRSLGTDESCTCVASIELPAPRQPLSPRRERPAATAPPPS
eukprot:scaffold30687_cov31-Tisochrysis_lutea.AAC.1